MSRIEIHIVADVNDRDQCIKWITNLYKHDSYILDSLTRNIGHISGCSTEDINKLAEIKQNFDKSLRNINAHKIGISRQEHRLGYLPKEIVDSNILKLAYSDKVTQVDRDLFWRKINKIR